MRLESTLIFKMMNILKISVQIFSSCIFQIAFQTISLA